jgi:hypothetical protein
VAALALVAAIIAALALQSWLVCLVALPLQMALVALAFRVTRTRVIHIPLGPRTVGDLVIYITRFGDHRGYRFTRNEISLKVRFVIAEWLGVPVEQVGEDSTFTDDLGA